MSFTQLVSLFEEAPIMTYVASFFIFNLAIVAIEVIVDLATAKKRRWRDSLANFTIFLMHQLIEKTLIGAIVLIALLPFQYLTPFAIQSNWWTWVLAIVAADFTYYWMHRIEHESRILWGIHSVHHSSEDYNLSVSMRLSIIEPLVEWIFLIPMVLIGFSPFQAIVGLILVAQYQTWIHTERIGKLGWLDTLFNTPSVHRVHHGSNKKYLDKNYGGISMIWDHLFGTYQEEEENVSYGLTKNIETNNPLKINFIEFKNIWSDVKKCRNLQDKFRIIFGGLVWRPDYFKDPDEINK